MAKYTAHFETVASATITMEVPDEIAAEGAEAIQEWIWENTPHSPSICAQCSGWGKTGLSLELNEFEPSTHDRDPHKGMAYVTDMDGNEITGNRADMANAARHTNP